MALPDYRGKRRAFAILLLCQVMVLSLWFSSTAVIPSLRAEFALSDLQASLLSSMVSVGFVAGALISAFLGLADRLPPQLFFASASALGAGVTALLLWVDSTSVAAPALRFLVGAAMAGVYPVGMKMAATWARGDMGLLVGTLVGALTLGSAMPHLINALGGLDWRLTLSAASAAALGGGLLIFAVPLGPNVKKPVKFQPRFALQAWTRRSLRLANFGYFGHMWELYALWSWIAVFLLESFRAAGVAQAELWAISLTFATIAAGAPGSMLGGLLADRFGRTALTAGAMAISGACAAASGWVFGLGPWLAAPFFLLWGMAVIADSAQFSSSVMELADPWLVGTMVTVQTSIGFLLTVVTIHLTPIIAEAVGWQWSLSFLAIGPALGVWAMLRLRRHPDAEKLAGGRR